MRSIARDLGDLLGTGAHLTELRREAVGDLGIAAALSASRLDDSGAVVAHALTPLEALPHLPAVALTAAEGEQVLHGQELSAPEGGEPPLEGLLLLTLDGQLLSVAEAAEGRIRPRKVFSRAGTSGP